MRFYKAWHLLPLSEKIAGPFSSMNFLHSQARATTTKKGNWDGIVTSSPNCFPFQYIIENKITLSRRAHLLICISWWLQLHIRDELILCQRDLASKTDWVKVDDRLNSFLYFSIVSLKLSFLNRWTDGYHYQLLQSLFLSPKFFTLTYYREFVTAPTPKLSCQKTIPNLVIFSKQTRMNHLRRDSSSASISGHDGGPPPKISR